MSVSEEEQAERAGKLQITQLSVTFAVPFVGDFLGLMVVARVAGIIFIKSEKRLIDLLILCGIAASFFPGSYLLLLMLNNSNTPFIVISFLLLRFFISIKALIWASQFG